MNIKTVLLANTAVRFGLCVLGLLIVIALLAPWLGTVNPAQMDSNHINTAVGAVGQFSGVQHTFWMGADSIGRDIYSRVLYGTRVSLLVGLASQGLSLLIGVVLGLTAGYRGRCRVWPSPCRRTCVRSSGSWRLSRRGPCT